MDARSGSSQDVAGRYWGEHHHLRSHIRKVTAWRMFLFRRRSACSGRLALYYSTLVPAALHPPKSSKPWNVPTFQQLAAYLRWSTGLYLAGSGSITLIFWWTSSTFFFLFSVVSGEFRFSIIQHGQLFFSFPPLWLGDSLAKAGPLWSWWIREFTFLFAHLLLAEICYYCYYVWVDLFFLIVTQNKSIDLMMR